MDMDVEEIASDTDVEDAASDPWEIIEDLPAYIIRSLVVPIPGHVEPRVRNEILNISKLNLLAIVPQGDPRPPEDIADDEAGVAEGCYAIPVRPYSAPRIRGPGRQHEVVLR